MVSIPVIASGGAGKLEHFYDALTAGGADAALAASLFHYRELSVGQVKAYLAERSVPVRITSGIEPQMTQIDADNQSTQSTSLPVVLVIPVSLSTFYPTVLKWDERGLITAVVQDAATGQVLMVAWMNRESLDLTLTTGETHFWSRSRGELWHKGATSGNIQRVVRLWADCDADTLLVQVEPAGPACHTGAVSCFYRPIAGPGSDAI